jgi:hypothetical protein
MNQTCQKSLGRTKGRPRRYIFEPPVPALLYAAGPSMNTSVDSCRPVRRDELPKPAFRLGLPYDLLPVVRDVLFHELGWGFPIDLDSPAR